jgi:hypothetical protein
MDEEGNLLVCLGYLSSVHRLGGSAYLKTQDGARPGFGGA